MGKIISFSIDDILLIHEAQMNEFGGKIGLFKESENKIGSILFQIESIFGYCKYKTLFEKTSALMYFLVKDHCFPDGNKRVCLATGDIFLRINGYELELSNEEAEKFVYNMAKSIVNGTENIDSYILKNSKFLEKNSRKIL